MTLKFDVLWSAGSGRRPPLKQRLVPIALIGLAGVARADTFAFDGVFENDDDLAVMTFNLSTASTFTAQTFGWAGDKNEAGVVIPAGSFAPVLSLYDAPGTLLHLAIGSSGVCGTTSSAVDIATGACWDTGMTVTLAAGAYTLVLTQDGNTPLGPTWLEGFARIGQPNYTGIDYRADPSAHFINVDGSQRNSTWAVHLSGDGLSVSSVPEPATWVLWLTSLLAAPRFFRKASQ